MVEASPSPCQGLPLSLNSNWLASEDRKLGGARVDSCKNKGTKLDRFLFCRPEVSFFPLNKVIPQFCIMGISQT